MSDKYNSFNTLFIDAARGCSRTRFQPPPYRTVTQLPAAGEAAGSPVATARTRDSVQ
jgi:hypothetical protein